MYTVTYTGTVTGTDTDGVFGTAGAILDGAAFTSTYTYDPSKFGNADNPTSPDLVEIVGGSLTGNTDPILSDSLTINGVTFATDATIYGLEQVMGGTYPSTFYTGAYLDDSRSNYLVNDAEVPGQTIVSLLALQEFDITDGGGRGGYFIDNNDNLSLTSTFVSVTDGDLSVVPEPASLPLLASTVVLFGLALSARRMPARKHKAMPRCSDLAR